MLLLKLVMFLLTLKTLLMAGIQRVLAKLKSWVLISSSWNLTLEAGQVEQKVAKEKADVVRVRNDYNRRVGGLEVLQKQFDTTADAALKAEIEKVMEVLQWC